MTTSLPWSILGAVKNGDGGFFGEDLAGKIDANFTALAAGSGAALGPYATTALLPSAATNVGSSALVGSVAPYQLYFSDGINWNYVGSQSQPSFAISGLTPAYLSTIRLKIQNAAIGQAACKILCAGDSTTQGSTGGSSPAGTWTLSYPYRLYKQLINLGYTARYDAFTGGTVSTDTRVTLGTGWAVASGYFVLSAGSLVNSLDFLPTGTVDRFDVTYADNGSGTLRFIPNAEANQDVALTGDGTIKKHTFTCNALGANTAHIFLSNASAGICAVEGYNSALADIRVVNQGVGGALASTQYLPNGASQLNVSNIITSDISLFNFGTNDSSGGAGNIASMQFGLNDCYTAPNCLTPIALSPNFNMGTSDSNCNAFQAALHATALAAGVPVFDMRTLLGGSNAAVAASGLQTDPLHPTAAFYDYWARYIISNILR